jgi:MarC family membrane protein
MIELVVSLFGSIEASKTVSFFVESFVSLFVIVNAIGNVPVFSSPLQRFEEDERRTIIRKAVLVGGASLLVVTLTGNVFFRLLGIELYSFRIAGGILLAIVSVEMLYGRKTQTQSSADIRKYTGDCSCFLHRFFFPLSNHRCHRVRASSKGIATPSKYGILRAV